MLPAQRAAIGSVLVSSSKTGVLKSGVSQAQPGVMLPPGTCFLVPSTQKPGTMVMQTGPLQPGQVGQKVVLVPVASVATATKGTTSVTPGSANRPKAITAFTNPTILPRPIVPATSVPSPILSAGPITSAPWQNIATNGGKLVIGNSSAGHLMMAPSSQALTGATSSSKQPTNNQTNPAIGNQSEKSAATQGSNPTQVSPNTPASAAWSPVPVDITSSPPAGSASTSSKKILSGPMLIEIQSDCNWDQHKKEIISKIAKHTSGAGLQPGQTSMRVGKYVVEIVSKKEEVVSVDSATHSFRGGFITQQPVKVKPTTDVGDVILIDDTPASASKRSNLPSSSGTYKASSTVKGQTNPNSPDIIELIDIPDSPPQSVSSTGPERSNSTETVIETSSSSMVIQGQSMPIKSSALIHQSDAPVPVGLVRIPPNESTNISMNYQYQQRLHQQIPISKHPGTHVTVEHLKSKPDHFTSVSGDEEMSDVDIEGFEEDVDVVNVESNLSSVVTNLKRKLGFPFMPPASTTPSIVKKQKVNEASSSKAQTPIVKRKRKTAVMTIGNMLSMQDLMQPKFVDDDDDDDDDDEDEDEGQKMVSHGNKNWLR